MRCALFRAHTRTLYLTFFTLCASAFLGVDEPTLTTFPLFAMYTARCGRPFYLRLRRQHYAHCAHFGFSDIDRAVHALRWKERGDACYRDLLRRAEKLVTATCPPHPSYATSPQRHRHLTFTAFLQTFVFFGVDVNDLIYTIRPSTFPFCVFFVLTYGVFRRRRVKNWVQWPRTGVRFPNSKITGVITPF